MVQKLWQFAWHLRAKLVLDEKYHLQPYRTGDMSIMTKLAEAGFAGKRIEPLNRVRKYKKIMMLSEPTLCDGVTIKSSDVDTQPCQIIHNILPKGMPDSPRLSRMERGSSNH